LEAEEGESFQQSAIAADYLQSLVTQIDALKAEHLQLGAALCDGQDAVRLDAF
jgi:hypothetical protein